MRLRHQNFETVDDVNAAIAPVLEQLNAKAFQKLPGSRASAFAQLDAPALQTVVRNEVVRRREQTEFIRLGMAAIERTVAAGDGERRSSLGSCNSTGSWQPTWPTLKADGIRLGKFAGNGDA